MATYYAEADALQAAYNRAVGDALELGILVYYPGTGGRMKGLGDLRDEISAERERRAANAHIERICREVDAMYGTSFTADHLSSLVKGR